MKFKCLLLIVTITCLFFFSACSQKAIAPQAEFDTPQHHVNNGNKFLESGEYDKAYKEFTRAKELNPDFSPAFVGTGLVYGYKNDFKEAFNELKQAEKKSKDKEQKLHVNLGYMRVYTLGGEKVEKKWLKKVESKFKNANKIDKDNEKPYYYMGMAYKKALMLKDAAVMYKKVLDLDKMFVEKADKEYAVIQKIERAIPGTKVGKQIALLEKITRGDIAALFIEELNVDELFKNRTKKQFNTSFQNNEENFVTENFVKALPATDIEKHVLKADIDTVIKLQIKGLQPFPDHRFLPDQFINRAEFAIMIEDILIKIIRDDSLATKFIGSSSPFPDLRSSLSYFNAAMVCTTRNIMETKDVATGEFAPNETVSGAEAMLSIRILKNQLKK